MITRAKTDRAIEALKRADAEYFGDNLSDYVIECLEELRMPPVASEAILLKSEIDFILRTFNYDEQEDAIHDVIDDAFDIECSVAYEDEPLYQPSKQMLDETLNNWHVNVIAVIALAIALVLLWSVK